MINIKYNNSNSFEEVSFSRNNNVVTITPTIPNTNGFTTWRMDGKTQLGDFSDFTTVYKVDGDSVSYSNDGSIYVEPPKPTEEELMEKAIEEQIATLKQELATYDYIGVKISMGVSTKEEYADKIAYTETLREKIRELENKLAM